MTDEEKTKLNKHDQIIERLDKSNETLFNITSKMNGEYIKMDKEGTEYRTSFSKDLDYIKKEIGNITGKLDTVIDGYVKRDEFEARFRRLQEEIDGRIKGANDRIDSKVDEDKFDEHSEAIKETLQSLLDNQKWITRLIIGAVVTALLGLVLLK